MLIFTHDSTESDTFRRAQPRIDRSPEVKRLDTRAEHAMKSYSGTAIYTKNVHLPIIQQPGRLWQDLGKVHHLATVTIDRKSWV